MSFAYELGRSLVKQSDLAPKKKPAPAPAPRPVTPEDVFDDVVKARGAPVTTSHPGVLDALRSSGDKDLASINQSVQSIEKSVPGARLQGPAILSATEKGGPRANMLSFAPSKMTTGGRRSGR